ncbi:MAG: ABC transporter ATP-binding protein [Acidimicrobiia bacterium]|nr:ABC transporter ATP-binding protein [Acidimicrobiia bacterium]
MRAGRVDTSPVDDDSRLDRDSARRVLRRLSRMLVPYRRAILVATVVLVAQTGCLLAGPALVRAGVDNGLVAHDAAALNRAALAYLIVAIIGLVLGRSVIWLVARTGERFLRELRERLFRHMTSLSLDFFDREKTGRLVSRMTSDIDALQELISQGLVMFVQNFLIFVGAIVVIVSMSWQLSLGVLLIVPPVVFASRWFRTRSNLAYLEVRERIGENLATLQEGLEGVRVVQAFGQERGWIKRFHSTNENQYEANLETVRISAKYFPFVEFTGVVGVAVIVGWGGVLVDQSVVSVGTVLAFVLYLNNLFEPIQQLSQLYNTVQSAGAALHKIFGLLDTAPSIGEKPGAVDLPNQGALEVAAVTFAYGGDAPDLDGVIHPLGPEVLRDVSLSVAAGERVALVGPTGAGKSTLAKLMARFYDPRGGAVSFGGVDLRNATLSSLRRTIVVVPQEGFLFAGTVRDNIRIGRDGASDEAVDVAVAALGLEEIFAAFPDGLDTEVRERGSRLSAGEKQLVSLTRAALADPPVLVLDEATSNLDPGTEHAVERAMDRLTEGRTVVVVAHRLSTAARCDRIAVVDNGGLMEVGSHDELLARGGRYATLYAAWDAASMHHPA